MDCLWCGQFFQPSFRWNTIFGIQEQPAICEKCRNSLIIISGEICRVCGRMLEMTDPAYVNNEICVDCLRWEEISIWKDSIFLNRSLYAYNEAMKDFFTLFKFRGDVAAAEGIREEWQMFWRQQDKHDLIVPIPLSEERLYERGFNQSLILAEMLSSDVADVLLRPFHLEKQSKKTRKERLHSKQNVFTIKKGVDVQGKTILLIDDIYTTGTTVRNAAMLLYEHGAHRVQSLTVARAY